jgi:hypothetical protein
LTVFIAKEDSGIKSESTIKRRKKKRNIFMEQQTNLHPGTSATRRIRTLFLILLAASVGGMLLMGIGLSFPSRTTQAQTIGGSPVCPAVPHTPEMSWSPTGVVWKLTVTFLSGSRQGQSEQSVMTFANNGSLTATFPGVTPDAPALLAPAIDGSWCMTGVQTFRYQFKEPIVENGKMVAYVATHIEALLTSKRTFEAGGFGSAYATATGLPLPGQYNITQTFAVTSGQ